MATSRSHEQLAAVRPVHEQERRALAVARQSIRTRPSAPVDLGLVGARLEVLVPPARGQPAEISRADSHLPLRTARRSPITLAGTPPTMVQGSTSPRTTAPAARIA